ncbi:MAG: hypothetical protein ABIM74_03280 [candidate division WOR-3 bacterium]
MDKLIATLSGFTEKVMVLKASEDMLIRWAKPYGDVYVLESLWKGLGLEAILSRIDSEKRNGFPLERAIFCMVYHRLSDPGSKLSLSEKLREEYLIEGSESLELHHLYRALDLLYENKERISAERAMRVLSRIRAIRVEIENNSFIARTEIGPVSLSAHGADSLGRDLLRK